MGYGLTAKRPYSEFNTTTTTPPTRSTTGPITMTEQGDIMLPSSCPVFLIFDYIRKHAAKARNLQTNFKRYIFHHYDGLDGLAEGGADEVGEVGCVVGFDG